MDTSNRSRDALHDTLPGGRRVKGVLLSRAAGWICVMVLVIGTSTRAAPSEFTIRFATAIEAKQTHTTAMFRFKEALEKRSQGRVNVEVFHSGQLGATGELVSQVKSGTVTMTIASTGFMTAFAPKLGVFNFPFLFASREAALRIFDGPVGQEIWKLTEAAGFKNLGCEEFGWRATVNNKRPITKPEDFRGIKIRVQPIKVHLETYRLLGAIPVAMDFKELHTSLQQKVIDAVEINPAGIYNGRFYEVTRYLSVINFFYEVGCRWMSKDFWDRLPPAIQNIVMETSMEAVAWQRKQQIVENDDKLGELVKVGMKRNDLTPQAVEAFKKRVGPIYDKFGDEFGRDLIKKLRQAGQR